MRLEPGGLTAISISAVAAVSARVWLLISGPGRKASGAAVCVLLGCCPLLDPSANGDQAGLTQEQLAEALVVERRTVVGLERGIHTLTLDQAVHVAAALHVPLWRLFRDDYATGGSSGTD